MLLKVIFSTALAVGVLGRSLSDEPYSPYSAGMSDAYLDEYSQRFASELCKATDAEEKEPEVKAAVKKFVTCVSELFDSQSLRRDMEETTGDENYAILIKKYCAKAPQFKDCSADLVKGIAPCLPANSVQSSIKSTNATIDFFCDHDAARVTSFVEEGGIQCFEKKQFEILICSQDMKTKASSLTSSNGVSGFMIPNEEKCSITDQALKCFANTLKDCSSPTPGRLAQEFHDVFMQNTCAEVTKDLQTEIVQENKANVVQTAETEEQELKNKKLKLEVRSAELEIWNWENVLNVQHTDLTSDLDYNVLASFNEDSYSDFQRKSFVEGGGVQCIKEKELEMAICYGALSSRLRSKANGLFMPDKEMCRIADQALKCFANTLKGCSNRIPVRLAQEFHDVYMQNTCAEVTKDLQTEVVERKALLKRRTQRNN